MILSACSPFFKNVLRRNPHQHPLLYLKGVKYTDLQCVLNFMYHGDMNVAQEELSSFLAVAEDLRVKGLTQNHEYQASLSSFPVQLGLTRLAINICYMTAHLLVRLVLLPIWCKLILAKYLYMWLMTEGVFAIPDLSLSVPESGYTDWTDCANVKLKKLESATMFGHYIQTFNINTANRGHSVTII